MQKKTKRVCMILPVDTHQEFFQKQNESERVREKDREGEKEMDMFV